MNKIIQKIQNKKKFFISTSLTFLSVILLKRYFNGSYCKVTRDLSNKIVIITGANAGIGAETAKTLAVLGATVILACRDEQRTQPLLKQLQQLVKNENKIIFIPLDLSDLNSVKNFANLFQSKFNKLDILINNAGVMGLPQRQLTKQQFEMQFGVNHLGHFYLTKLLKEQLKNAGNARVINVSALGHDVMFGQKGHIHFEDINFEHTQYLPFRAYAQSKLANILFTRELQRQYDEEGLDIISLSLHPGVVRTELGRYFFESSMAKKIFRITTYPIFYFLTKNQQQGSQTTLYCALEDKEKLIKGEYYSDCKIKKTSQEANNIEIAKQLWKLSEKMIETSQQN